ncbi:unnamed protein product [Hermetia illucens]|uniref:C2H2-type domain-containing protein n=1 Tax=Hermetia illucens TaxID=343691 RepID=A0A7R8V7E8_HERIL|nr:uncharacterized protein LOC119660425 [Hermetia illucens]CAD7093480.1 unnamed protein product [Hermetia illucens]
MERNTSYRLSGNNYDTATEDSISMYYSFNGSVADKTLENSDLESTVEAAIEETLNTVVKLPSQNTPLKAKCGRSLQLGNGSSSTPSAMSKGVDSNFLEFTQISEQKDEEAKVANEGSIESENVKLSPPAPQNDSVIVETFSKMQIETITITDNSVEIIDESSETVISVEGSNVALKDASAKIWPSNNKMEITLDAKSEIIENIDKQEESGKKQLEKSVEFSLADKVVQDIKILLQSGSKSKKGKENLEANAILANEKKRATGLLKPSRLSTLKMRRSILHTELQPGKTITPVTRIISSSRKSFNGGASGIPTPREMSSSSSVSSLKSNLESVKKEARRSIAPSKQVSIMNGAKAFLNSIPENSQKLEATKKAPSKRFSMFPPKPKADFVRSSQRFGPVAKTTLNSPVMVRKDLTRRSVSKFTKTSEDKPKPDAMKARNTFKAKPAPLVSQSDFSLDKTKQNFSHSDFTCEICSRSFRVSSIFEAHKKTHNQTTTKSTNTCKYCDKSFAIMKALDKHLLENCLKIPMAERKKIKIAASQLSEEAASLRGGYGGSERYSSRTQRASIVPSRKSMANSVMPPPSSSKVVKKPMAHSGVLKTPNKSVSCKPCEKTFDNVLAFAEHVLSHSNSSLGEEQ